MTNKRKWKNKTKKSNINKKQKINIKNKQHANKIYEKITKQMNNR